MKKLLISEIKVATNGSWVKQCDNIVINDITLDSREANINSLFIPIVGENYDAFNFIEDAYNNGCRNFLIDKKHKCELNNINLISVNDTVKAYGLIANYYKKKFKLFTITVTGSVGKTSMKDIIASVLNEKYHTLKNIGNLNNEIGIPKTIFNLDETYEAAVLELGIDKKNQMDEFTFIANPDIAVITNIGMSHIENFKSQEIIFKEKAKIAKNFKSSNLLIINGDDEFLKTLKEKEHEYELLSFGFQEGNDIICSKYDISNNSIKFTCKINNKNEIFTIPTIAKHNIYSAMAAILIGLNKNMTIKEIKAGLKKMEITKGRLTIMNKKKFTIIDDSYNASGDSMISALNVLSTYTKRRVAILGDVLETGKYDQEIHKRIGKNIIGNVDFLILVGNSSKYIEEAAIEAGFDKDFIERYGDYETLIKDIDVLVEDNDIILIKASHGIKLDKVVEYLDKRYD